MLTPLQVIWRRHVLERSCRWTRPELERNQQQRLTALRRFALDRSPFYQRFHRGYENEPLERLPILTKAVMMEHFDALVTDAAVRLSDVEAFLRGNPGDQLYRGQYVVLSTSGSTGERGVFLFDRDEWLTVLALVTRPLAWAQALTGWGWPPRTAVIASSTPWHYSARVAAALATRLLPALRMEASEPLTRLVQRLNEWQPKVLATYPSVLKQLVDEQLAGRLDIPLRCVASSAEVLTDETRQRVRQAWGIPVFDSYSATEYTPIAAECAYGHKHLFEDGAIIEIVDDRGQPVEPGAQGIVLLTVFDRRTQPLIRYEISDLVRPLAGSCECGRPFRMIDSIDGRREEILYFPRRDGRDGLIPIHPTALHGVLEAVPASGWQIRQETDGLTISLARPREASVCERLTSSVRSVLEQQGAAVGAIRVHAVDTLQRGLTGKAPPILIRRG
jgi:phenylacetate-coenzyme A ligase PaaK-like adenylate-forming protein